VLLVAEQRGEARRRVEARQAHPVDRAVPADEGGGLQVADDSVVFDSARHRPHPRFGEPRSPGDAPYGSDPPDAQVTTATWASEPATAPGQKDDASAA
jgi:hypothetical protein